MRSGSTLLLHLLMMSDDISGMGERNALYASRADLSRLFLATRLARHSPFRRLRYIVDQVNHNRLTPDSRLMNESRVRLLFLLRQPLPSINSLMTLSRTYYGNSWTIGRAADYYVERLEALAALAAGLANPGCAAFVTYEALVNSPQETLESLRQFLGLREPLPQTYRTYSFTRTRGDPMPGIAAGQISGGEPPEAVELSVSERQRVTTAYQQCSSALGRFAPRPPS